jgi:hypothetical protein
MKFVNYVITNGEIRPFMVLAEYPQEDGQPLIDGIQFRNGSNDDKKDNSGPTDRGKVVVWRMSVKQDDGKRPGTYHASV